MDLGFGFAAIGANLAVMAAILLLENWYSKRHEIRPRAKDFFYLIDYKTIVWGDTIGLSLIDFGVFASWSEDFLRDKWTVGTLLALAFIVSWIAHKSWFAPGHPASITYPESGKSNIITGLHLAYFLIQAAIGLAGAYLIFIGYLATVAQLAVLFGIVVYAIFLGMDAKGGKF